MKYYGVRRGRLTGIFEDWESCRAQVYQFPGAEYKSFTTREEAEAFLLSKENSNNTKMRRAAPTSIEIWVDGSCFPHPSGSLRVGWGLLVKENGKEIYRDKGNDIPETAMVHRNVAGEILAIIKALQWLKLHGLTEVTIYYDYQGLESWATGAWRANLPLTQNYARVVKESGLTIHWVKVKAHSGNVENEIVDQLAKEAAMEKTKRE